MSTTLRILKIPQKQYYRRATDFWMQIAKIRGGNVVVSFMTKVGGHPVGKRLDELISS